MTNRNNDVKQYAKENGVYLWEIAKMLGIPDNNFSRKLRREFPEPYKQKIRQIIDQIAKEKGKHSEGIEGRYRGMRKRMDCLSEEQRKFITNRVHDLFVELKDKHPDLTQKEIAQTIGISSSTLNRIFKPDGKKIVITLANLIKIADYFNVNLDYLIKPGEVKSTDIKKREICKALGISDQAFDNITALSPYHSGILDIFLSADLQIFLDLLGFFLSSDVTNGELRNDDGKRILKMHNGQIEVLFLEQIKEFIRHLKIEWNRKGRA